MRADGVDTSVRLAPVVVTGKHVPLPAFAVPTTVSVITADAITHGAPGFALSQSLARVPGVVAQNRQSYAQDLQISIRGFGARASFGVRGVRLMLDGLPLSLPDGQGQTDALDLAIAQRISVLRGPFATLYGNAAGGVIRVFTRDGPDRPTLGVNVMRGSYGTRITRLHGGGTAGNTRFIVDASRFRTDGYRQHSKARRDHLYSKWTWRPTDATTLRVIFNAENQPLAQDPSGLTREQMADNPRQAVSRVERFRSGEHHRHRQSGVVYTQQLGAADTLHASVFTGRRRVFQRLPFRGDGALSGGAIIDLRNSFGGGGARWTHRASLASAPFTFTFGADTQSLHERRKGHVNADGRVGALRRNEDDHSRQFGQYVRFNWNLDDWVLSAGARHTRVSFDSRDHYITELNPDDSGALAFAHTDAVVGVLYRLSSDVNVYADVGTGFHTPVFSELAYRPDGSTGLNLALKPSTSRNLELGAKWRWGRSGKMRLALFDIRTQDDIVTATSVNGRSTFRNAGQTRRRGVELYVHDALGGGLEGTLAGTWLSAVHENGPFDGKRLPGIPRQAVYAELRWRDPGDHMHVQAHVQWRSPVSVNDRHTDAADGYAVVGIEAGLHQDAGRWRVEESVRINNLLDRAHVGAVIVNAGNARFFEPAPTRHVMFGLDITRRF